MFIYAFYRQLYTYLLFTDMLFLYRSFTERLVISNFLYSNLFRKVSGLNIHIADVLNYNNYFLCLMCYPIFDTHPSKNEQVLHLYAKLCIFVRKNFGICDMIFWYLVIFFLVLLAWSVLIVIYYGEVILRSQQNIYRN